MRVQPGRVLGKAYRVERALGAGGVGAVFEAVQVRTGRRYAVKVLLPEIAMREGAAKRFRREAEALAAVGHSGIVQIHDFDTEDDGTQFLVMDLLEGEDLATRIAREGALDLPFALRVLEEIGAALGAAHELGIVHRDLKPANVFLSRRPGAPERATILDFGLAKNLAGPSVHLTATGVGLGTPLYMSPEQARGEDVDLRTDVYALGCILFEMLTGNAPFTGATISIVIAKILTEEPPLVSALAKRPTPPALDQVVRTALAKSASDRYPSARAFLDAVHRAAGDSSDRALAATAVSPGAPAPRALTPQALTPQALPLTREGLEAVPSIRPAAVATSEETTRPIETRAATPPSPWPWIAVGVLVTLGVGGGLALTAGSFDRSASASEQETVSASEASETRAVDHVLAIDRAVVDPEPTTAPPLEEQPSVAEQAIEATPHTPIESAPHAARARRVAPSDELVIAPSDPAPATTPVPAPVAPPPPTSPTELTAEQRAYVASQSSAAARSYDVQIAANERRLREYERALPDVLELRRQAALLARGTPPAACTSALRQRLASGARGDEAMVASVSAMLESSLDPVCDAFEAWQQPSPELVSRFAAIGRDIDHGERMVAEAGSDVPPDQLDVVRRAMASFRRLHEAQPPTYARYPCRDAAISELEEASQVANGWARAAADRPRRAIDRVCTSVGVSERRLAQLGRALSDRTDAAEQQLREATQQYTDMNTRLVAARAQLVGATR